PGEDATINFRTRDQAGRPVSAALGVEIVDEAVFALSDKQPGFEKIFMYLEKELLTPRYEVHQFSFDKVLQDDFDGERPLAAASRERAAQVLFAAAGTVNDRDIRGEFGRESIDSKRAAYAEVYGVRLYQSGQRLALEMTAYYASHPPSPEGFGGDLRAFVAGSAESANLARDPWGNQLVGEGQLGDAEAASFTLTSLGPDGRKGTADDITYLVYARRDTSGVNRIAPFKGQATVRKDVIAGGRSAIEGIVKDGDGSALGQAKITAQRIGNGRVVAVYSDGQGRFVIPDLAPGHYTVRFEHSAFQDSLYQGLRLKPGARAKVDVVLDHLSITPISLSLPYGYYPVRKAGGRGRLEVGALNGAILGGEGVAGAEEIDMRAKGADLDAPIAAPLGRPAASANAPRESGEKDKTDDKKEETSGGAEPRVRSFFPETLYTNPVLITDGEGRASVHVPMADSITTWRITSLASTTRGSMGSATFPIRVLQDFFADLDVPAAITEGDVISAPVAVYNYLPAAQQVTLDLRQDPWFTLEGDTATKTLQIGAGEVGVAYFKIKASKIGQQQLQVTARLADSAGIPGDAVARPVNVLPNGEEKAIVINERLEGSVSKDVVIPEGAIPDASKILVKLYPGALSQVVEGLDSILRMPGGCFEQTSSSTYPDVLVMDYLKTSKKITPELQAKAEGYISLGYQRLVTFEVPGGGFSWFGQAPANKILTAYGLMEFADMSRVHEVDPKVIERTQNWLVSQQQPDGGFKPDTEFINEGATTHYNTDILRITAY
ncbi:MAG TPA: alpha-2-macroglobulin family protein, partial [Blastocatellia bacterium]|nr:alpha-2-macroglobulin family protein [Blastocatellia bacterium]